jgi:hypothetical protein
MDPDPGGPKTCGSGSGSGSLTLLSKNNAYLCLTMYLYRFFDYALTCVSDSLFQYSIEICAGYEIPGPGEHPDPEGGRDLSLLSPV